MSLVEVAPILKRVAREQGMRSACDLREDKSLRTERIAAMVALREAGLTLRSIGEVLECDHSGVRLHTGSGVGKHQAASYCADCDSVLPLSAFNRHKGKVDGCQPYCRECKRKRAWRARAAKVRYRRRESTRPRVLVQAKVAAELHDLLATTAARHRTSKSAIVERALAKAMACTNCHNRLRTVESNLCGTCEAVWGATA